jgi:hypothetical protein
MERKRGAQGRQLYHSLDSRQEAHSGVTNLCHRSHGKLRTELSPTDEVRPSQAILLGLNCKRNSQLAFSFEQHRGIKEVDSHLWGTCWVPGSSAGFPESMAKPLDSAEAPCFGDFSLPPTLP